MLLHRTCCHVSLPAFSPISVMTSWPAWAAMAGGHNRRGSTGGVGHARRSWNAVRDDYPRPSLTGNAARALPFPKSQRPTCPLSVTPGGTPPARPSATSAPARCEPFLVNSLLPRPPTRTPAASVTGATARCEPFPAFPLLPGSSTCPAWLSAAPASARYEPIPAFPLLPRPPTRTPGASVTGATARCGPILEFPLLPGPPTCPAWPSAAPVAARCEPFSANRLTPASRD